MPLTFDLKHDFDRIAAVYGVQQRQVRFAAAVGLTKTAGDLQRAIQGDMPNNFTLRRQWVVQGIRIKPARKDYLTAEVYSRDPFMGIQESGGTKTAIGKRVFEYQGYLAIPLDARRSKYDIVRREDWPRNLIDPFILTARDGRKYLAVHTLSVGKTGPRNVSALRGKQKRSTGTRLMYTLVKSEELKARLGMRRLATVIVPARWNVNYSEALVSALSSARVQ